MSVIVPIFNGVAYLSSFFESLRVALPEGSELILVDDGSTEPVFDVIPDFDATIEVSRLSNGSNLGYCVAVNRGFRSATGDIIVQLNTDLVLDPHCITAMIDLIQDQRDIGIVGSKLVFPTTGLVQHMGMAFGHYSTIPIYLALPPTHPLCQRTREVQIMAGATVGMTRQVWDRIGPLDERYFNSSEDIDHCLRASQEGLRNFVCAESVAHHWESLSGPARYARIESSDALFWSTWGSRYEVDLGKFVDEALDHVFGQAPGLETTPFEILNLSRGANDSIVVESLARRWPGIDQRVRSFRQMNNSSESLWLPLILPHWVGAEPRPFIYLVDHYRDLKENVLWFETRHRLVGDELVVDLNAVALHTSEIAHRS